MRAQDNPDTVEAFARSLGEPTPSLAAGSTADPHAVAADLAGLVGTTAYGSHAERVARAAYRAGMAAVLTGVVDDVPADVLDRLTLAVPAGRVDMRAIAGRLSGDDVPVLFAVLDQVAATREEWRAACEAESRRAADAEAQAGRLADTVDHLSARIERLRAEADQQRHHVGQLAASRDRAQDHAMALVGQRDDARRQRDQLAEQLDAALTARDDVTHHADALRMALAGVLDTADATSESVMAIIGRCWAGGTHTGAALTAHAEGHYPSAVRRAARQILAQTPAGPRPETLGEVAADLLANQVDDDAVEVEPADLVDDDADRDVLDDRDHADGFGNVWRRPDPPQA